MSSFYNLLLISTFVPLALGEVGYAKQVDEEYILNVRVSYEDLDLAKEADASEMLQRLEGAAHKACGGSPKFHSSYDVMPKRTIAVFRECRKDAVATAVKELNATLVTQLHAGSA